MSRKRPSFGSSPCAPATTTPASTRNAASRGLPASSSAILQHHDQHPRRPRALVHRIVHGALARVLHLAPPKHPLALTPGHHAELALEHVRELVGHRRVLFPPEPRGEHVLDHQQAI